MNSKMENSMAERATDVKEQIGRIDGVTGSAVVIEGHTGNYWITNKRFTKKRTKTTHKIMCKQLSANR